MRSKHCITLWLTFGSCAALILPAPRRPVRTRHHAAPPLEFVKAVGAHLPLNEDATCSYVHRDPDVLVLRDFIKKEDCDGLLKAGRAALGEVTSGVRGLDRRRCGIADVGVGPGGLDRPCRCAYFGEYLRRRRPDPAGGDGARGLCCEPRTGRCGDLRLFRSAQGEAQALRTSKSVALRGQTPKGEVACYARLLELLPSITPESCEALTLIKYDPGDALAPHYDANRAADAEDAARGGQTLATLLVYLNDVDDGGRTRFNKLDITVAPRKGGRLFFPADASGQFDERLEHEGEAPRAEVDGRIWVHQKPSSARRAVRQEHAERAE